MTTLLEHILAHYLGQPRHSKGNGCSYWDCPACGHYSFHTYPFKPGEKDRAKCWNPDCTFVRGDEFDLLKVFHPKEKYGEQLIRIRKFVFEYGKQRASVAAGS